MLETADPRSNDVRDRIDARNACERADDALTRGMDLPNGPDRERVHVHEHAADYDLRGSESRALAAIGAFRVVAAEDLRDQHARASDIRSGDLQQLKTAGLIRVVAPLDRDGTRTAIVTLTERGRELLESRRLPDVERPQTFYAGAVKTRELSHDAQVYRAFLRVEERLRSQGARVDRVVLDYEMKREYQQFLQERNRANGCGDGRPDRSAEEVREWARQHELSVVNGHVQFPDVRVEYEHPDGRRDVENVEVTTVHYRGRHAAGKAAAGFTRFRAKTGRVGGTKARTGSPFDPNAAEELLS